MNADQMSSEAASALRAAAADLIARAEALEANFSTPVPQPPAEKAPLAPPTSDQEIKARLVLLDLSSAGRSRDETAAALAADFPEVDAEALLNHFYA
jgi:hypothetical protein